jgi:predicted ferric reductase
VTGSLPAAFEASTSKGPQAAPSGERSVALRAAAASPLRHYQVLIVAGLLAAWVVAVWSLHGGAAGLLRNSSTWMSLSQLTGLFSSACGVVGLALIARPRWLERLYGMDRMFVWHRLLGESMAILLAVHVITGVEEYAGHGGHMWSAIRDLTGREAYMAGAFVGAVLLGLVTITSLKSIRRQLSYETWYFVHLLAYVGVAVSFGHEIVLGGSLAHDRLARVLWVGLHVTVATSIVVWRWGSTIRGLARPLRVVSISRHNAGVTTVRLGGRGLQRLRCDAGQFFLVRPLRRGLWWQAHPFSLSSAPTTAGLSFTIKNRGDATQQIFHLPLGAKVAVEGPYGVSTPTNLATSNRRQQYLFIAGGVGIAPVKALLERLDRSNAPVVLYRAHSKVDLVHLGDVRQMAEQRGGVVHALVGPSAGFAAHDPFSAKALARAVPNLTKRVVVLCGPDRLVAAARSGLHAAGVPPEQIHFERVWW